MIDETVIIPINLDTYILGRGVICELHLDVQDIMHLIMPSKKFETIETIAQAVSDKINKDRMMFELTDRFSRCPTIQDNPISTATHEKEEIYDR